MFAIFAMYGVLLGTELSGITARIKIVHPPNSMTFSRLVQFAGGRRTLVQIGTVLAYLISLYSDRAFRH